MEKSGCALARKHLWLHHERVTVLGSQPDAKLDDALSDAGPEKVSQSPFGGHWRKPSPTAELHLHTASSNAKSKIKALLCTKVR